MRFMVTYTIKPEARPAAVEKFVETGGPPPEGVTMLGRWHDAGLLRGYTLCESDSVVQVAKWTREWADHITQEVVPVLNDEEIGQVLAG